MAVCHPECAPFHPEYSPCHPERSEGSWEWRTGPAGEGQRFFASLRMTEVGRSIPLVTRDAQRRVLGVAHRASWRGTRILRFAQNDRRGTLESDKDSSAAPQNDKFGGWRVTRILRFAQNDKSGTLRMTEVGRSIPLVTRDAQRRVLGVAQGLLERDKDSSLRSE